MRRTLIRSGNSDSPGVDPSHIIANLGKNCGGIRTTTAGVHFAEWVAENGEFRGDTDGDEADDHEDDDDDDGRQV